MTFGLELLPFEIPMTEICTNAEKTAQSTDENVGTKAENLNKVLRRAFGQGLKILIKY
jgi:hypothetical protein